MMMKYLRICTVVFLIAGCLAAQAQNRIRVIKTANKKSVDFGGLQTTADAAAKEFHTTLLNALLLSGSITKAAPDIAEYGITGAISSGGDNAQARIQVVDRKGRSQLFQKSYEASGGEVRRTALKAADEIIEAITGSKGFASARLLMVGNRTKSKELYIADSDGRGLKQVTSDRKMVVGPRWNHDGKSIFYSSNLRTFVAIYKIDLDTGKRTQIANYSGMNASPAVSPDGRELAMVLSWDGNPELYVMNLATKGLTRLTNTKRGNEASPSWSPDGRQIVYVSDSPGTPQLFIISRNGGSARQVTSRGTENVAPDWGINNRIAYASKLGGRFQICVLDPASGGSVQITTDARADHEDPSWAPNGRHIACALSKSYSSKVYLIDTMGDPPVLLSTSPGDWYAPKWTR